MTLLDGGARTYGEQWTGEAVRIGTNKGIFPAHSLGHNIFSAGLQDCNVPLILALSKYEFLLSEQNVYCSHYAFVPLLYTRCVGGQLTYPFSSGSGSRLAASEFYVAV